jgi:carboxypeptidase C (cathepsin A)
MKQDRKTLRMVMVTTAAALYLTVSAHAKGGAAVSQHEIHVAGKTIDYVAEAGTVAIRDDKSGEAHGHMFFTAYRVPTSGTRPVMFLWNGGPGANSAALHFEAFGPKRISGAALSDNDATLLTTTDLVFVDPIGTGFSRSAKSAYDSAFYSTLGDFIATETFIRTWLAERHAENAPIYLVGESFGVWRAAGVAEALERDHRPVAGIVLISGGAGVGNDRIPRPLSIALRTPNRAATALFYGKLPVDIGTEVGPVVDAATAWAKTRYAPALAQLDALTDAQRDAIAHELARFTGLKPDQIDRHTLAVSPRAYLGALLKDQGKTLNTFDMRRTSEPAGDVQTILSYFHHDLGYNTTLAYAGLDATAGASSDPTAPAPGAINRNWNYNSGPITPEVMAAAQAGEGPPGSQPWALNAIALDPKLRILVAAGLYDSLNSCAANDVLRAALDPAFAGNFTMKCYSGGHMMYRDDLARAQLSADVKAFVSGAAEH